MAIAAGCGESTGGTHSANDAGLNFRDAARAVDTKTPLDVELRRPPDAEVDIHVDGVNLDEPLVISGKKIGVRFISLARGSQQYVTVDAVTRHPECPIIPATDSSVANPVMTECFARGGVEEMNDALESLTGYRLFEFESYVVEKHSLLHTIPYTRADGTPAGAMIDAYDAPGLVTVLLADEVIGAGGFATLEQRVNEKNGIVLTVSMALSAEQGGLTFEFKDSWTETLLHELGHAWGAPHFKEEVGEILKLCEGVEVPWPPEGDCVCEPNHMEPVEYASTAACPPCVISEGRFDTPVYGDAMRGIARCWLRKNEETSRTCAFEWSSEEVAPILELSSFAFDVVICDESQEAVECACPGFDGVDIPKFPVSGCGAEAREERYARAAEACGSVRCQPAGRTDLVCEGLASNWSMPCLCPDGKHVTYVNRDGCEDPANEAEYAALCTTEDVGCSDSWGPANAYKIRCVSVQGGYNCSCNNVWPTQYFMVESCEPDARDARTAAAEALCGVRSCQIPDRPDIECSALGLDAKIVSCQCPSGQTFELPGNCFGADNPDGIAAACGELDD